MKIKDLRQYIAITGDNIEVNTTAEIEHYFFEQLSKPGEPDYREQAIDFSIKNHLPVTATQNNGFNLIKRYIKFICPVCGHDMEQGTGSGNGCEETVEFHCAKCKVVGHLSIPVPNGIDFHFTDGEV